MKSCFTIVAVVLASMIYSDVRADDWPMWRHDAGRTGVTDVALPDTLQVQWVRHLPKIEPAFHSPRLQFDAGYEPVVADGRLIVGSSLADSVTACDVATGKQSWVFRTNGPVRLAPAIWNESVCFGSDDGCLYCVELRTGKLRWKQQAVPSTRKLLGNRRLISVWPVRGGPVVADGNVYFAAGVWPFEGVFVYAMEIETGKVLWRNDRLGYLFGQQPHNTEAIGGLAPQGYLIVNDDELVVPCSTAYPARLNRETGELVDFKLPAPGRLPGGWFASVDPATAKARRRGEVTFDKEVNSQLHEDTVRQGKGAVGISRQVQVNGRPLKFDHVIDGVEGTIHSIVVAGQRMFVSVREGRIYCLTNTNAKDRPALKHWREENVALTTTPSAQERSRRLIRQTTSNHGYAIVVGLTDGSLVRALLKESQFHIIAIDDDRDLIERLRREFEMNRLYGARVSIIEEDPSSADLPPYIASLLTTEAPNRTATSWQTLVQSLQPFGGVAALWTAENESDVTEKKLKSLERGRFEMSIVDETTFVKRVGSLPGAAEYAGNYALSEDELVRFPLGVLWFDDTLAHFKRSPQPEFADGVMISRPKDWHAPRVKGNYSVDYPLLPPVLSDIYTGRVLNKSEQATLRSSLKSVGLTKPQQSYYHAPHQKTALHPKPPVAGERVNPLTGEKERRVFPKTYGCDGGVDYGDFYTLRSGTAAFYDKSLESGTVFLSGPRSGCTNSIIPSGGLLNVPYFYEGCTCSYPLPTAMSLMGMPETHEQWSSWGKQTIAPGTIQRIGLNFGSPGDRMTRAGTLWLDYPSVGGPSPAVNVDVEPSDPTYHYRHSVWMQSGDGWPWVAASSIEGLEKLTLHDLKPGNYTVKLTFCELENVGAGTRKQTITVQGRTVLTDFDILARTKKPLVPWTHEIKDVETEGDLVLELNASSGKTLVSGIEVVLQAR